MTKAKKLAIKAKIWYNIKAIRTDTFLPLVP